VNRKTNEFRQTDLNHLAIEQLDRQAADSIHEASHREYTKNGVRISHAFLDGGASYHTLITGKLWLCGDDVRNRARSALTEVLLGYLTRVGFCLRSGKVLFCGLGNEGITADALGPMICSRLMVGGRDAFFRSAGFTEMYVMKTGVPSQSGIGTGEHIKVMAKHLGADLIITADAAAAKTVKRLASVVQITDRGTAAGAGCGSGGDEISAKTMPCPVISICVPTVIRSSVLAEAYGAAEGSFTEEFLVSFSEIDTITECYADLIAHAVNSIFSAPLAG